MKKQMMKKILSVLDMIEIQGIQPDQLPSLLLDELDRLKFPYTKREVMSLIPCLFRYGFLKDTGRGIDLSPCATILAKSDANSKLEALALFECYYRPLAYRSVWHTLLHQPINERRLSSCFDPLCASLFAQSTLFSFKDHRCFLTKEYEHDIAFIMQEYEEKKGILLSSTLCAYYTRSITAHESPDVLYKNEDRSLIHYPYLSQILHLIPRKGVPSDRSETKALQSFYKDTLFHECNHACVLCKIDIAQMLVASHIKPFRDCAHIYEAIDHNNGLLLCRNHDFLFDQGFFCFDEDGTILISKEMKQDQAYQLFDGFHLDLFLQTKERLLFLDYHRKHIFKGKALPSDASL